MTCVTELTCYFSMTGFSRLLALTKMQFGHGSVSCSGKLGRVPLFAKWIPLLYNVHGGFSSGYHILSQIG
jgi:hypothetical protein